VTPAWALKAGATLVTLLFAIVSAHYVGDHQRNQAAPLRPSVLHVDAGVRTADVQPVTTTYAS
jgi:hypothetical protein